jgi:hypothetical protein
VANKTWEDWKIHYTQSHGKCPVCEEGELHVSFIGIGTDNEMEILKCDKCGFKEI